MEVERKPDGDHIVAEPLPSCYICGKMVLNCVCIKAKFTYLWDDWPTYTVNSRIDCRSEADQSAYDSLVQTGERCIQMGKVCVERIN